MFTKISVLIPTRGRQHLLRRLITSHEVTTHGSPTSELVFRVDDDDQETQQYLSEQAPYQMVVGHRYDGYRSLPTFFNELYRASDGDIIMCGNDDMVFRTPDWDQRILEQANRFPDGIFDFGVVTHNHLNFPFATVSRKALDVLGFLYDPRVFWGDIFLLGVMGAFGRAIYLPDVVIDHDWMGNHPDATFAAGDEVRRSNWMEHHQHAIDDAVEKLSVDPAVGRLRTTQTVIQRTGWSIVITEPVS